MCNVSLYEYTTTDPFSPDGHLNGFQLLVVVNSVSGTANTYVSFGERAHIFLLGVYLGVAQPQDIHKCKSKDIILNKYSILKISDKLVTKSNSIFGSIKKYLLAILGKK